MWFKTHASTEFYEILRDHKAMSLLLYIAAKTQVDGRATDHDLGQGWASVNREMCGLTEKECRGALSRLKRAGLIITRLSRNRTCACIVNTSVVEPPFFQQPIDYMTHTTNNSEGDKRATKGRAQTTDNNYDANNNGNTRATKGRKTWSPNNVYIDKRGEDECSPRVDAFDGRTVHELVNLNEGEIGKLVQQYGSDVVFRSIDDLGDDIGSKDMRPKNHYYALRKYIRRRVEWDRQRQGLDVPVPSEPIF